MRRRRLRQTAGMGQADPLVDVVIPVYNGERTIRRSVESVLSQAYQRIHVIVVDDGSTDSTSRILHEFHDPRLSVVSRPHEGVSAARNAGISAGRGDYVTFLDADDEPYPRWLQVLVELADGSALVGCAGRIEQEGHQVRVREPQPDERGSVWPVFLAGLFMVKRGVLEQAGGYDVALARSENTDLGYRLVAVVSERGEEVKVTDEILVWIRRPREQASKYSPRVRRTAAEAMLAKNPQWRTEEPRLAGTYRAIAGYSALREGDVRIARSHLSQAVRLYPTRAKYWLLLARTWMPRSQRAQ